MYHKSIAIIALFLISSTIQSGKSKHKPRRDESSCSSEEGDWGWNNNWSDKSNTKAYGTAASNGNGYSGVAAGKDGVSTGAYGTNGVKSESGFEQQNSAWGVSNGFNNDKKGGNAFSENWEAKDSTKASTKAEGKGEAGLYSHAGAEGANVFANGTKGTNTALGWNNAENNWSESFAYQNSGRKRLLTGKESCSDEDDKNKKGKGKGRKDDDDKMIAKLKKELEMLKKENEEIRKRCKDGKGNRVGASY